MNNLLQEAIGMIDTLADMESTLCDEAAIKGDKVQALAHAGRSAGLAQAATLLAHMNLREVQRR